MARAVASVYVFLVSCWCVVGLVVVSVKGPLDGFEVGRWESVFLLADDVLLDVAGTYLGDNVQCVGGSVGVDRAHAQCWFGSCPAWSRVLVDIAILAEVADPCLGGWAGDVSLRWVLAPSLGGWPLS